MGFYEDDRIRNKNRAHHEAFEIYQKLTNASWCSSDILTYAENKLSSNPGSKVHYELFKMALNADSANKVTNA